MHVGNSVCSKDIRIVFAPNSIAVCLPASLPCSRAWTAAPQQLFAPVSPHDCTWSLDGQGSLEILLAKQLAAFWRCVVVGHPVIDSTMCRGPDLLDQLDDDASKNDAVNMFSRMLSRLGPSNAAGGSCAPAP
jgi:hypothetical protein